MIFPLLCDVLRSPIKQLQCQRSLIYYLFFFRLPPFQRAFRLQQVLRFVACSFTGVWVQCNITSLLRSVRSIHARELPSTSNFSILFRSPLNSIYFLTFLSNHNGLTLLYLSLFALNTSRIYCCLSLCIFVSMATSEKSISMESPSFSFKLLRK